MTIFSRFASVSLVTFLLFVGLSSFFLYQLFSFYTTITYVIEVDNRLLEKEKKLGDRVLAYLQNEKKYLALKDAQLYAEYQAAGKDALIALDDLIALADSDEKKTILQQIRVSFSSYSALAEEETRLIAQNRRYPADEFSLKKSVHERDLFTRLDELQQLTRQDTFLRINNLRDAMSAARTVTSLVAAVAFLLIITLSFLLARSITGPINSLMQKSREIAHGKLAQQVTVTSPPEIAELDAAFFRMAEQLRKVDAMKSDFFATMSHELRTPLTSINEAARLLTGDPEAVPPNARKRLLVIMAEQSHRLIGMVSALLDLSKMESGMMQYHFRTLDISQIVTGVVKEHEPLAAARGISLRHESLSGHCLLKADDERIRQVMRNLIANALRFTPRGGSIAIHARRENNELLVSVSDSGTGIPAEDLATIFHKYRQSSQPGSRRNGTGLGLAIVKNIISAHGGRVWAESTPGAGSTFTFALPC